MTARIAAIILAAGMSRRMRGTNKLFLKADGETLLRRAVQHATGAGLSPVVVVVGHEAERACAEVEDLPCECVFNEHFDGPMSESMHAGLACVPDDAHGAVVVLPDMVHVTERMIAALRASTSTAPLVVSRYGGVTAPPILFRRVLFAELMAWNGEGCGKGVVRAHAQEAESIEWPAVALGDVDTPDDASQLL